MENSKVFLLIMCVIFFFVGHFFYINYHEEAHIAISKYHGCTNYTKNIGLFGGSFHCNTYETRTIASKDQEMLLHSINEIVSYNLQSVILLIGVFMFFHIVK